MKTMKALFTFGGYRQEVMIITEYQNGYFWIELKNGECKNVHKTYITKL
jgi:hypothetical protein